MVVGHGGVWWMEWHHIVPYLSMVPVAAVGVAMWLQKFLRK